jgi:hypothetical protein
MKSVLKKGKPVIEMHAPDRRALESAKAVAEFVMRNTESESVRESAMNIVDGAGVLLAFYGDEAAADKKDAKQTAAA